MKISNSALISCISIGIFTWIGCGGKDVEGETATTEASSTTSDGNEYEARACEEGEEKKIDHKEIVVDRYDDETDPQDCWITLREAVAYADAGATIRFYDPDATVELVQMEKPSYFEQNVSLLIHKNLKIIGNGEKRTRLTTSENPDVFLWMEEIDTPDSIFLELENLEISGITAKSSVVRIDCEDFVFRKGKISNNQSEHNLLDMHLVKQTEWDEVEISENHAEITLLDQERGTLLWKKMNVHNNWVGTQVVVINSSIDRPIVNITDSIIEKNVVQIYVMQVLDAEEVVISGLEVRDNLHPEYVNYVNSITISGNEEVDAQVGLERVHITGTVKGVEGDNSLRFVQRENEKTVIVESKGGNVLPDVQCFGMVPKVDWLETDIIGKDECAP